MTGTGAQRICALRLPGSSRARLVDAGAVDITLGDWATIDSGRGEEPGQIVVAPDQWIEPITMDDLPMLHRRLDETEIDQLADHVEQARGLIPLAASIMRSATSGCFLTGLRLALTGEALILVYCGNAPEDTLSLARQLSEELGLPVHLEQEHDGPMEDVLLGGSSGQPSRARPETFRELIASRLDVLREPGASAPHGMPRLNSRVQTPLGPGTLIAVEIRHWKATVQLDDGEETTCGVEDLIEP